MLLEKHNTLVYAWSADGCLSFVSHSAQTRKETDQNCRPLNIKGRNSWCLTVQSFIMVTSTPLSPAFALLMQIRSIISTLWISFLMLVSGARAQQTLVVTSPPETHSKDQKEISDTQLTTPSSVNYHFTRQCNYKCGFCFHTAKTSFVLPIEEAKTGLRLLKEAGNVKFSFLKLTSCCLLLFNIVDWMF